MKKLLVLFVAGFMLFGTSCTYQDDSSIFDNAQLNADPVTGNETGGGEDDDDEDGVEPPTVVIP